MADVLPQKRSASVEQSQSDPTATADPPAKSDNTRYNRLISILAKSLTQSREKIASDAPQTIKDSYGDMTSLFTSSEDSDGVSSLVDLLLGKLDSVHHRFMSEKLSSSSTSPLTRLEKPLQEQHIFQVLQKIEAAIDEVERNEREFNEVEETDKNSAKEAIKMARSTRISPSGKKRRVLPAESIGFHAHKLKVEYQQSLTKELEEIEKENEKLEEGLKKKWGEWQTKIKEVKSALDMLDKLGGDSEGGRGC
mmetsp:Transcript_1270/g.2699  ORF Transcript_1270/g.2699 Transcript_1270/m.2699 type:complete len:251 (+) Transcript_1270:128-880(+)|eukprot:CAMPEP_0172299138 /NCGR_PEP_ID=MMETSP1058-20130122/1514_1 /TAXON_ID=83371 /ORGANISM="Detonula confervacea, Strain CCMP 353" /LENGTH=250 /DNA_ID=CAMNT_0013008477 /DNA_START=73 /DNA_END=825 /DNA_ORIENTATION=+